MQKCEHDNELSHHGIKGQKWGIRRFQQKDGSLTPAGRKRYSDSPELQKQKEEFKSAKDKRKESSKLYDKATRRYQNVPLPARRAEMEKARSTYQVDDAAYKTAKLRYKTNKEVARIQDKGITFAKKSKHRLRLEEQYKKMGMSDEQAQAAANNRIRTEKILAASATLTVAACATYIAVKRRKDRIDGVIKAGEKLQRVEMRDTNGKLHDVFYASKGDHDNKRYKNLLGMDRKSRAGRAYLMELRANSDIKVASKDKAGKVFGDLYKNDSEFRDSVQEHVKSHFGGSNKIKNLNDMSDKNIKKMYENFNSAIPLMREDDGNPSAKFFKQLKSAGYGAIQDINDMKYSGYSARNPLIVFDNQKSKNVMVKSVKELTGDLNKSGTIELLKATGESSAKLFIEKAGPMSAAAITSAAAVTYVSDPKNPTGQTQGGKKSKWV